MFEKCKSFLFTLDLIGTSPQLYIFNNKRYKSLLSSLFSVIIIIISLFFSIFSLLQYFKYDSPYIGYSKDNDENTNRNFKIKDFVLMFQLIDSINTLSFKTINDSIAYYEAIYYIVYNNGTDYSISLDIEKCEFGKTIDKDYEKYINSNKTFGRDLEEFYCINIKNKNLSLFYNPEIGFSSIVLLINLKNNSIYNPENLQTLIISENNIIDHYNRNNPIKKSYIYQFTASYSSLEYTKINYNFQYIKYESDEGLLYKKSRILNGLSFSDISFNRNYQGNYDLKNDLKQLNFSTIGTIEFLINKSNFDSYKRNYQRLQSLLAEVMSVVSLLFEIGRQISNFLGNKKMNKSIFEFLFNKKIENYQNDINKINNLFTNKANRESTLKEEKSNSNSPYLDKIDEIKLNISKEDNKDNNDYKNITIDKNNINNEILKKTNFYHIIKSFFPCFKDEKTKLINKCYEYINRDMSIDIILQRIYALEKIYYKFSNEPKKKVKIIKKKRLKGIDNFILIKKSEKEGDNYINNKMEKT